MSVPDTKEQVTGDGIRAAMRRVPSAVTVVTVGGEEPRGITIGSFVTVSLDPPLVSFNVQQSARIHDDLVTAPHFAVHILAAHQEGVSEIFADPDLSGQQQLERVPHEFDDQGIPALHEVLARFDCIREATYPAGDHTIVLGRVSRLTSDGTGRTLLYLNREYRSLEG